MTGRGDGPAGGQGPGWFDRFAAVAARLVSKAWFFAACVLMVVVWAPTYFLLRSVDTWQLVINTATTIVTFLLVALLQNSQERSDKALQRKTNAVAAGLAVLLEHTDVSDPAAGEAVARVAAQLRASVGLEEREHS
jgi:hypothetical protein